MIKEFDFVTPLERKNRIKESLFHWVLGFSSYPRLVLEVFLRTNMGERYFKLSAAITVFIALFIIPFCLPGSSYLVWYKILGFYWSWYAFLAAFAYFSWKRFREVRRLPGVWDFARYSKSRGVSLPFLDDFFEAHKLKVSFRSFEIFVEPSIPFVIGLLLLITGQSLLGVLLVVCAVIYCISIAATYHAGDEHIMNVIDRIIVNEERIECFRNNTMPQRGVQHVRMPTLQELRDNVIAAVSDGPSTIAR